MENKDKIQILDDIEGQEYFLTQYHGELKLRLSVTERPITLEMVEQFILNLKKLGYVDTKEIVVPQSLKDRLLSKEENLLWKIINLQKGIKIKQGELERLERDEETILE